MSASAHRRSRFRHSLIGAAALAAIATQATHAADAPAIVFTGTGDAVTQQFTVEDAWEVSWQTEGQRFQLTLMGTDSGIPSIVADQIEPRGGSRNYIRGGGYHFDVRANGAWRIEVRQSYAR